MSARTHLVLGWVSVVVMAVLIVALAVLGHVHLRRPWMVIGQGLLIAAAWSAGFNHTAYFWKRRTGRSRL